MSDKRVKVEHPSWCNREECTAPEFRPTHEEYVERGAMGSHYSATLGSRTNDLQIFLAEQVCPWETEAYLIIRVGEDGTPQTVPMSETGGGFALYALLNQEVKEVVRKYPTLYAERFPYVQRAIEDEADEATADAVIPRDPVELEERMTAESLADEDATGSADEAPDAQHVGESRMTYKVTVNAKELAEGPLQEVKAAVADLVTRRLGAEPERVGEEAVALNMAFNPGAEVDTALADKGQWFTVFDAYGEDPLRIRVTRED